MAEQAGADEIVNDNNGEAFDMRRALTDLNNNVCVLKSVLIGEITTYEADPQNQADNFAFHLNMFNNVADSLKQEVDALDLELGSYFIWLQKPCPEYIGYCNSLENIDLILDEAIDLIWQHWLPDLEERVERHREREIRQVVEDLRSIKISGDHLNENITCVICLSDFEGAEEACQLRCHERHIFHRECIEKWLKRQNQCPMCRAPVFWRKVVRDREIGTLRVALHLNN
ncbi:uncharacterized protein LOC131061870 [Cryptomeria japonica]|uniref:uncharacterized protein LOC131061870 n=1 Tax=Cryptomeria japonica TaxID=3369 RepID=UPI0025AC86F9|nr:uncharacterized protein LOC131061870 [Cryptomeria japonica]